VSERTLYVYWCPVCECQTERPWHSLRDGGLIPQNDTEHRCERIEVVPREQLDAARQALERIAALDGHPTVPPPDYGDFAVAIARAALGVEGEQERP
jgi:hypothetical protein